MPRTVLRGGALPVLLLALLSTACGPAPEDLYAGALPERVDFNFHVKPILSDRCFSCHGPDAGARKAELRLDNEEGARAVITAGSLRRSKLFHRITTEDSAEIMPPRESGRTLSAYEKAILARWIEQGAEYRPHWSFIPPEKPALPAVRDAGWAKGAIDRFVLARLEREGLQPSPEADRERLLRRVTLDLTGLPPTLEELESFRADRSPKAYERVVDRLLASPAYGERMATPWLDLARYTDSHGYQDDGIRHMWRWRDWVIDAFNRNRPYDEFVTWQLAGDLLPNARREQVLATGFNRNHAQSAEGGIVDEEYRVEYVADRVTTLGRGLMGLSTDCARCHTHKFDPISHAEYYQLFAFFNNVDEIGLGAIDGNNGPVLLLPDDSTERKLADLGRRIGEAERALRRYRQSVGRDAAYLRRARAEPGDVTKGLVGHFSFDSVETRTPSTPLPPGAGPERVAANLADPGHPATLQGELALVPGKLGRAFEVEEGSLFSVREAYGFDRADPFTLSVWVYATRSNDRSPILVRAADDNGGANRGYELNLHRDTVFVGLMHVRSDDAIRVQTRAPLPLNAWTHLAVTYDGSARAAGVRVYVDGAVAPVDVLSDNLRRTIVSRRGDPARPSTRPLQIGGKRAGSDVSSFQGGRIDEVRIYDRPLGPLEVARLAGRGSATATPGSAVEQYLLAADTAYARLVAPLRRDLAEETRLRDGVQDVMVMRDRGVMRPTHRLDRGAYDAPRERVEPGTPAALLPFPKELPRNRLGLARWLFDPRHPLTARVAVNRYWQMLFGTGLVKTSDDFGSQGELPSHPELLDWLAVSYRESGWDTRAMLKQMVMSATYRQSSRIPPALVERDPQNRLLARGPSHRLPAEMIRDAALAASGLLVPKLGGASVKPYQPEGLWEEKSAGRGALARYVQDHGESLYRRSLYTVWKLSSPPPMLITFDATEHNVTTVRRASTNTPPQALGLLNDPQFVEAARVLAERMVRDGGEGVDERLRHGFRRVLSRNPSARELAVLRSLHQRQRAEFAAKRGDAAKLLQVGEWPRDRALPAEEVAAYTMIANTLFNTDEFITKR